MSVVILEVCEIACLVMAPQKIEANILVLAEQLSRGTADNGTELPACSRMSVIVSFLKT